MYSKKSRLIAFLLIVIGTVNNALAWPASAQTIAELVRGKILLQVEQNGEAWYVHPKDGQRYFLGRPHDAFTLMHEKGLGVSNSNFARLFGAVPDGSSGQMVFSARDATFARKLAGRILLQVEAHGEAYYIYPDNLSGYYLGRPADAFYVMRTLGLGITNNDLMLIPGADLQAISAPPVHDLETGPAASPAGSTPTCTSNSNPVFTHHITDIAAVNYVAPPPTMGAGPSLKTHSYIGTDHARVPVYAPVAMTLERGAHYVGGPYVLDFKVSCETRIRFAHITEPADAIKRLLPSEPKEGSATQDLSPIAFAAGDLIAYTTGTDRAGNWDFGVYNSTQQNRYAQDPAWNWSDVATTAVCPFDYFTVDLKAEYTAKFSATILSGNPPHGESFCG